MIAQPDLPDAAGNQLEFKLMQFQGQGKPSWRKSA